MPDYRPRADARNWWRCWRCRGGPAFVDRPRGARLGRRRRRLPARPPAARPPPAIGRWRRSAPGRLIDADGGEHPPAAAAGRSRPATPSWWPPAARTGDPEGRRATPTTRWPASALATSARLGVDPRRDRWLACLPLAHVGGLSVVTRALRDRHRRSTVHARLRRRPRSTARRAGAPRSSRSCPPPSPASTRRRSARSCSAAPRPPAEPAAQRRDDATA